MQSVTRGQQNYLCFHKTLTSSANLQLVFSKCGAQQITIEDQTIAKYCEGKATVAVGDFCQFELGLWDVTINQNNQLLAQTQINIVNEPNL